MTIEELAAAAGVPKARISKWKSEDKWEERLKEAPKKKGGQRGNKNAAETPERRWSDGYLALDFSALTAWRGEEKLSITPNEYKLLLALTENAGKILTRQILLEKLWDSGGNFIDDHTLTVTMNRLRSKIEDETHTYIRTVRGMGYIWKGAS